MRYSIFALMLTLALGVAHAGQHANLYEGQPTAVYATTMPVTSLEEGVQRGDDAWRQGQLDMAVYLYIQALQFDNRNAPILAKIGAIHESRGNLPLARRAFELAREYDPSDTRYSERLGLIEINLGDDSAALDVLSAADRSSPERARVLDGLGLLALRRGAYPQAMQYFERARLRSPRTASIILHRGQALLLMGNTVAAEHDARIVLQFGEMPEAWRLLGEAQASSKNYHDALESFAHVMDLAHAYEAAGNAAMKQGDHEMAREYFERATQTSPTYFETAHRNLAIVTAELAKPSKASGT